MTHKNPDVIRDIVCGNTHWGVSYKGKHVADIYDYGRESHGLLVQLQSADGYDNTAIRTADEILALAEVVQSIRWGEV